MQSAAATVEQYLDELPPERQEPMRCVRELIRANLPEGYEERMQYGMIGWYVPLERYPKTYNGRPLTLASLASQKRSMSLYLMCVYGDARRQRFDEAVRKAGKKLDMGKSCIRFRSPDDLPLDVIGQTVAATPVEDYLAHYEASRG